MTLASLVRDRGSTLGDAARACGVDPLLFERVDADAQPLPKRIAARLAAFLGEGTTTAEVLAEAPRWTASSDPIHLRPIPGSDGFSPDYRTPAAPPEIRPDRPAIWAVRPRVLASRLVRLDRNEGIEATDVDAAGYGEPSSIVRLGGLLWVASLGSGGVYAYDELLREIVVEGPASLLAEPVAFAAEPISSTLWFADLANKRLTRVDTEDGDVGAQVDLSPYEPVDVCAVSGFVYALGRDESDPAACAVLRIDPVAETLVATSAGLMPHAAGICSDGAGLLYVVGADPAPALYVLEEDGLEAQELSLSGATLNDPASVSFALGKIWISDATDPTGSARLVRVDPLMLEAVAAAYVGDAPMGLPAGRSAGDGVYLWLADPQGPTRKIHPLTLEVLLACDAGGEATALHVDV